MQTYVSSIEKIKKSAQKLLFTLAKKDVRTVTGFNLRSIMLIVVKDTIEDINNRIDFDYPKLIENKIWK